MMYLNYFHIPKCQQSLITVKQFIKELKYFFNKQQIVERD